ncbi:MAG: hypothetical protein CBD98_004035 [Flavobacteriaceae bacterium TMED238]|jgi:hypothetical protein|nr:MAG: hypothetical protein CBD98_004035 [Flavobacteriaceae bacterium TMED238]
MKNFTTLEVNDKNINKYLFYKNLDVNRKYSSNKKIIKKIDHYQWWFLKQKLRKSFFVLKENSPIFISTSDHFRFKNYKLIYSGLISCKPETNLFDLLKAIKIQNDYLDRQKNNYCFISIDKNNKVLMYHWKYFGYMPLKKDNIFYKYVKDFLNISNNYNIFYKRTKA